MKSASARSSEPGGEDLQAILAEVRRIEVQSRRLVRDVMAGSYTSVFRGSGIEFSEVREYVPGDDPRSVDWNVTARMGRPYVKKFVDERELSVLFLLDCSASMEGGLGAWSSRGTAVRLAACLALSAVRHDDKIGFVGCADEVLRATPPRKGLPHVLSIIRDGLVLPAPRKPVRLEAGLRAATGLLRRRSVVFVLSDWFSRGWEEELGRISLRHDVVAVRLLGPELEPPRSGLVHLEDPGSGRIRRVDFSSRRVREEWRRRVEAHRESTASIFQRKGVDLMDVPVPREADAEAIARPLLRFFRMREERGAKR